MTPAPALHTADVSLRDATPTDHDTLQSLDGAAPDAGAALIQARRNFFARTSAYSRCRTIVAEQDGRMVGMLCVALTSVRVAGRPCSATIRITARASHRLTPRAFATPAGPGEIRCCSFSSASP